MSEHSVARRPNDLLDLEYLQHYPDPQEPSAFGVRYAVEVLAELSAATPDPAAYSEGGFGTASIDPKHGQIPDKLRGTVWRGRYQMAAFQTFMLLCCTEHCHISAMTRPIDWSFPTDQSQTAWIFKALMCFDSTSALDGPPRVNFQDEGLYWLEFSAPMTWLATMMARSALNITACFDIIIWSKFLGGLDWESFAKLPKLMTQWKPEENARSTVVQPTPPYFGVFLPCGIDTTLPENSYTGIQTKICQKLIRIEEAYEEYFGVPVDARTSCDDRRDWEKDWRDWVPQTPTVPSQTLVASSHCDSPAKVGLN